MTMYLVLKWLHILSSVLLVGTGFGSAFYLALTLRGRNMQTIAAVSRLVVRADWWFTTPAVVLQPLTGLGMMTLAGFSFDQLWLQATLILYLLAGLCWLPVVWLQIRLARMAHEAASTGTAPPAHFWQMARVWEILGYPAFLAMLIIYVLMVFKPV